MKDQLGGDQSINQESQFFKLEGRYAIEDFEAIIAILEKLELNVLIDYSNAEIDTAIRILLDNFNSKNGKVGIGNVIPGAIRNIAENDEENDEETQILPHSKIPFDSVDEQSKAREKLLDRLLNNPIKVEQSQIDVMKAEYLKTGHIKDDQGFIRYMGQFLTSTLAYIANICAFGRILFKRPKHEFQRQIMMEDTINSCYNMGLQAIPIVLFLSCAWGVISALQASIQLKIFGADFYAIDLVIFMFFKAMGLLLSLIVLSARSGSSMIAKIGIMRISDEWNALKVLDIDPDIFLLKPKIIAFVVLMPFLAYVAAVSGIVGGYVTLQSTIGMSSGFLFEALSRILTFDLFISMLWKGPIFGIIIGLICAFEARCVAINSESVVLAITRGVVYSIFACVLVEMIFNILFVGVS